MVPFSSAIKKMLRSRNDNSKYEFWNWVITVLGKYENDKDNVKELNIKYLNWINQKLSILWQYLEICKQKPKNSLKIKNGCL